MDFVSRRAYVCFTYEKFYFLLLSFVKPGNGLIMQIKVNVLGHIYDVAEFSVNRIALGFELHHIFKTFGHILKLVAPAFDV